MTKLQTNQALLRALTKASAQPQTAAELHRQRVSYILGILKDTSGVTRERVERVLAEQEGRE